MMAIVQQGQEPNHWILTASTSPFYVRVRLPSLHPLESFDDQFRGFVHAEPRPVEDQIVILWIGPILVEIVLDELLPNPVPGVHDPDTQGRFGRENERRAPADDETFPTRAQHLEQADQVTEVGRLGDTRRGGKSFDGVHQEASAYAFVVILQKRDVDIQFLGQAFQQFLVVHRPAQTSSYLARHGDAARAGLATERDGECDPRRRFRSLCLTLVFGMSEGMRMLAEPGHGLGKVLGCGLLVHGILPYATWPQPAASILPLPRQTLSSHREWKYSWSP